MAVPQLVLSTSATPFTTTPSGPNGRRTRRSGRRAGRGGRTRRKTTTATARLGEAWSGPWSPVPGRPARVREARGEAEALRRGHPATPLRPHAAVVTRAAPARAAVRRHQHPATAGTAVQRPPNPAAARMAGWPRTDGRSARTPFRAWRPPGSAPLPRQVRRRPPRRGRPGRRRRRSSRRRTAPRCSTARRGRTPRPRPSRRQAASRAAAAQSTGWRSWPRP